MGEGGRAPGAVLVPVAAATALAFLTDHPLVLLALVAGAAALLWSAPGRVARWLLGAGLVAGAGVALLNPLVSAEGDLILWRGPEVPVFDLEFTLEEIGMGLAMGARLLAVALLLGAALAHVDADRLQAQVSRVAPRSALTCALAARLLPTLQRDARSIGETARLRGLDLATGGRLARARRAAPLALPLLGSGLERGLDVAEAMVARGYAAGPRTRMPERGYTRAEWGALSVGLALVLVAGAAVAGGADYRYYPVMGDALAGAGPLLALSCLGALAGLALLLRPRAAA